MAAWKILLTDGLEKKGEEILQASAEVVNTPTITADELLQVVGDYDALIVRGRTKVTPAVFAAGKKLKVVGRSGVGVDNIDLNAAKASGVTVVNAPIATSISVAELTLALMLGLVRDVPRADATMKQGKWLKKEFEGVELYGKTLGIIGFGRIGSLVAARGAAFGMRVIGYDPQVTAEVMFERGGHFVSLDELFAQADIISMHLPLTHETRGMINAESIAKMKKGVRIICAARGGVIDETALLAGLEAGQVAGAALDVFATEPPGQSALAAHPHVVCTPHIGAQTVEAQERAAVDISTEVLNVLKGETLRWKVA
jgi:D-3-phosphoglycerate dehydrogenase / 2-oxoglutarate reductase